MTNLGWPVRIVDSGGPRFVPPYQARHKRLAADWGRGPRVKMARATHPFIKCTCLT